MLARSVALKRAFDIGGVFIGLILAFPLMAITAIIIRCTLGSPVLFRQRRLGWRGRWFVIYKFRTMSEDRDEYGRLLPDSYRRTKAGALIRKLSLDELPQLWNVLKGDMSLVGPRPLIAEQASHCTPYQQRRHEVLPGITGWAQMNGRNSIGWGRKFALDVWYVDQRTIWLDLEIVLATVVYLLRGSAEDVEQPIRSAKPPQRAESKEAPERLAPVRVREALDGVYEADG